jgi:hypothetical protein
MLALSKRPISQICDKIIYENEHGHGLILGGTNQNAGLAILVVHFLAPIYPLPFSSSTMASMFSVISAPVSMPSPTFLARFTNVQLLSLPSNAATYTTLAVVFTLLLLEQTVYRYKKKHLPGDSWTIPIIGKFADSMKPTMEGYMKQWNSGALSALSVFNMCGSLNYSRFGN